MLQKFLWILGWYALVSAATFIAYGWDKRCARRDCTRISEQTLHTMELLGGWPGALLAQRAFHHKWRKSNYMFVFWGIVAIHVVGWIAAGWFAIRGALS